MWYLYMEMWYLYMRIYLLLKLWRFGYLFMKLWDVPLDNLLLAEAFLTERTFKRLYRGLVTSGYSCRVLNSQCCRGVICITHGQAFKRWVCTTQWWWKASRLREIWHLSQAHNYLVKRRRTKIHAIKLKHVQKLISNLKDQIGKNSQRTSAQC